MAWEIDVSSERQVVGLRACGVLGHYLVVLGDARDLGLVGLVAEDHDTVPSMLLVARQCAFDLDSVDAGEDDGNIPAQGLTRRLDEAGGLHGHAVEQL